MTKMSDKRGTPKKGVAVGRGPAPTAAPPRSPKTVELLSSEDARAQLRGLLDIYKATDGDTGRTVEAILADCDTLATLIPPEFMLQAYERLGKVAIAMWMLREGPLLNNAQPLYGIIEDK